MVMLDRYRDFVKERHAMWGRRYSGDPQPWTDDPILAGKKFCNIFRALDYGSQFVIKNLLEGDPADVLMRAFLYRITNRPEPWEAFYARHGRYPTIQDLATDAVLATFTTYDGPLFSPAYQLHVGTQNKGMDKREWAVKLSKDVFVTQAYFPVDEALLARPADLWAFLRRVPRIGPFLAMQVVTDWNYSAYGGHENEFICAGPGSKRGAELLAPGQTTESVIYELKDMWDRRADTPEIDLPGGGTHRLTLMDVQNSLCEFDKYIRHQGKSPKPYTPKNDLTHVDPTFPVGWYRKEPK